jgi:hypothetical protein
MRAKFNSNTTKARERGELSAVGGRVKLNIMSNAKAYLLFVILAGITAVAMLRWTLYSDASDPYAKISNKELQRRAMQLVKTLRELVYSYNKKDKELMSEYETTYLATRTTERQAIRDQWRKKSEEAHRSSVRNYENNFSSDSILIRDELYRRLPKRLRQADSLKMYRNPPNVLAIEAIADNLELLSKSLPDATVATGSQ